MAYEGFFVTGDSIASADEMFNVARTVWLAREHGVSAVRIRPESVTWMADMAGGETALRDITTAPWFDAANPVSREFLGFVPLSMEGLGDSTMASAPIEYVTNGGNPGRARHPMTSIVGNVTLVALSPRGAEYGKRWLTNRLRRLGGDGCGGGVIAYFPTPGGDVPPRFMQRVKTTRAPVTTRRSDRACHSTLGLTFTLTAGDPFEYSTPLEVIGEMGGGSATTGYAVVDSGSVALVEDSCPTYNYNPVYDPKFPALVPSPTAPNFLPGGWELAPGMTFDRQWARLDTMGALIASSFTDVVPTFVLDSLTDARMVRVSIFPPGSDPEDQCGALFSAVVSYLPGAPNRSGPYVRLTLDGVREEAYVWDTANPPRRADSLVYSPTAGPVEWASFPFTDGLLVTLDLFAGSDGTLAGDGSTRMALMLSAKSD